jgi:hypothetical protein
LYGRNGYNGSDWHDGFNRPYGNDRSNGSNRNHRLYR